ncbi:GtrA family protein [Solitalea koreensis]|uniref:Flippase GtrA (Transmembrane translocase of bactoprenol-linked glucose) n=1 Tax=Solitalea koreensis TaxID=543615 RepID=A0A521E1H5_9SPHI|nr:GtrA family protein [Solitalea koreensis]SMO77813.1 Putative flippase GtrA (transmembrane translocase of bactoprenol-linked glucose) [Solitalea koreensis]
MSHLNRRSRALAVSKKAFDHKVVRFIISGGTATMVDIVVYFLTYNYLLYKQPVQFLGSVISSHMAALCISFSAGFITNFLISKYFVFTGSDLRTRHQFFRYMMVSSVNFSANYFLLKLFVDFLHLFPTPARALSAVLVAGVSFFLNKYFAFRVKQ